MVTLALLAACSHIERLKIPLTHRVDRRVRHEELVRIDDRVYVKVPSQEAGTAENRVQYRYVPVEEYLANRETYDAVVASTPLPEEEEWKPVELDTASVPPTEASDSSSEKAVSVHFKKRLMVVPFQDLAHASHKRLSDVAIRSLVSMIQARSDQVILFDGETLQETLRNRGIDFESLGSPESIQLANQLFNVHAIVTGTINHFFTSSTESKVKGKGKTTYAIAEISAKLVEAASGRVLRVWDERNPIFASEGKGDFSKERAQLKAIEIITSKIAMNIIEELKRINWYATIAGVDSDRVYLSAGKLSGVQVGDVFSVYPPASTEEPKGEIRVAGLFGIDSSVAEITEGKGFSANDTVRPIFR